MCHNISATSLVIFGSWLLQRELMRVTGTTVSCHGGRVLVWLSKSAALLAALHFSLNAPSGQKMIIQILDSCHPWKRLEIHGSGLRPCKDLAGRAV